MGGLGSGTWYRSPHSRKQSVEESIGISINSFTGPMYWCDSGRFTWTWIGGNAASVDYCIEFDFDVPIIVLSYRLWRGDDVKIRVRVQTTPAQFGGSRRWFTCPACDRRCGKLYLPPGFGHFHCRKCHNLTYDSSREAHQIERLLARRKSNLLPADFE